MNSEPFCPYLNFRVSSCCRDNLYEGVVLESAMSDLSTSEKRG